MLQNRKGQNAIEYILLFVCVILAIWAALAPGGFLTQSIDQSLDLSITGLENIVNSTW
ncbi:MAG TPA: hypothetical protein VI749_00485 [Candidatus Omnitrophota bacterium]|nr:hypothetical protein [Candidatus Omnitrophota bacterium]